MRESGPTFGKIFFLFLFFVSFCEVIEQSAFHLNRCTPSECLNYPFWGGSRFGHLLPSFQTMQLSAAVGLTRLALLLGWMQQPLDAAYVPPEVISRQVSPLEPFVTIFPPSTWPSPRILTNQLMAASTLANDPVFKTLAYVQEMGFVVALVVSYCLLHAALLQILQFLSEVPNVSSKTPERNSG